MQICVRVAVLSWQSHRPQHEGDEEKRKFDLFVVYRTEYWFNLSQNAGLDAKQSLSLSLPPGASKIKIEKWLVRMVGLCIWRFISILFSGQRPDPNSSYKGSCHICNS